MNKSDKKLIVVQIYVDDIIFRIFPEELVKIFIDIMQLEFEMSMVGKLSCFLGLQIKQRKEGIFITQEKYAKNLVKRFGLDKSQQKRASLLHMLKSLRILLGSL